MKGRSTVHSRAMQGLSMPSYFLLAKKHVGMDSIRSLIRQVFVHVASDTTSLVIVSVEFFHRASCCRLDLGLDRQYPVCVFLPRCNDLGCRTNVTEHRYGPRLERCAGVPVSCYSDYPRLTVYAYLSRRVLTFFHHEYSSNNESTSLFRPFCPTLSKFESLTNLHILKPYATLPTPIDYSRSPDLRLAVQRLHEDKETADPVKKLLSEFPDLY
jgi:hypothetical protein